jgi:hypothetical protein
MKFRFITLITIGLLSLFAIDLNAQGFNVAIDSAEVQSGSNVCVPVRAKGFVNIASFQYALEWTGSILTFSGVQNIQVPGMSGNDFSLSQTTQNTLIVAWADPSGSCVTLADDAILYEICFQAMGAEGSISSIISSSNGIPPSAGGAEAYTCSSVDVWSFTGCVPGHIEILPKSSHLNTPQNNPQSFQLSPNPTLSATSLILESIESGTRQLMVINALGQVVLGQTIQVTVGANRFEIPSSALNTQGIYQVILQTAEGVSAKRLCVH